MDGERNIVYRHLVECHVQCLVPIEVDNIMDIVISKYPTEGMLTLRTMKSSQAPEKNMWLVVELVPWSLRFTPRKKWRRNHGVWGPLKTYFEANIVHWHGLNGFFSGRGKRGVALKEKDKDQWQRNVVILIFFKDFFFGDWKMKTREYKRMCHFFLNN